MVAAFPRVWTISLTVITGYGGSHLALFWPWEVSGLFITVSQANLCKKAMLLLCWLELLSKYWCCVSIFSPEQWRTRWKTDVWIEDTLYLGDGCSYFFLREKEIKRQEEPSRKDWKWEKITRDSEGDIRRGGYKNRDRPDCSRYVPTWCEFTSFPYNLFYLLPVAGCMSGSTISQIPPAWDFGNTPGCNWEKRNRSADCILASILCLHCAALSLHLLVCVCVYVCFPCLMRSRWETVLLAGPVIASHRF